MTGPDAPEAAFHRWLLDEVLPALPALAADPADGGYHARIEAQFRKPGETRFAVDTARQAYVSALAFAHSGRERFLADARAAWSALTALYWDAVEGGFRTSTESGAAKTAFDQGFALLASAQLATVDTAFAATGWAGRLWDYVEASFRPHEAEAFVDRLPRGDGPRCHNIELHFLEPLLVLAAREPGGPWLARAATLIETLRAHYVDVDTASLRQYVGPDLRPLAGDAGLIRNPGHHFEWAWMLRRYIVLSGDEEPRDLEHMLVAFARDHGTSGKRAPLYAYEVRPDGSAVDPVLRLWPQTEAIKVAAQAGPEGDDLERGRTLLAALLRTFRPQEGLRFWHEAASAMGAPVETAARVGSLFHIYVAAHELARCGERHAR